MSEQMQPGDDLSGNYLALRGGAAEEEALRWLRQGAEETPAAAPAKPATDVGAAPSETPEGGPLETAGALLKDIGHGIVEAPTQIAGGARDAWQEAAETMNAMGAWLNENSDTIKAITSATGLDQMAGASEAPLPNVKEPASVTGGIVRSVSQFLTGFALTKSAIGGSGAPAAMAAGAITDAVAFDEHQDRLSNLIEEVPELQNPVTEFLAAQPDDSMAEGKFKNAIEGLGLGLLTDGVVFALKALREGGIAKTTAEAMGKGGELPGGTAAPLVDTKPLGDMTAPLFTDVAPAADAQGWLKVEGFPEGKAANINLARLDTPDAVKEAIDKTAVMYAGQIDEARRGVITHQETQDLADSLGMTTKDLLARRKGEAFNAETALAARRILVSSADNLMNLSKLAASPNGSDVDMLAFRRALALHKGIQEQVSGMTAEAGRALSQFRIEAGSGETQVRAIRDMLDASGGAPLARQIAEAMSSLKTPEQVNAFAKQAAKATNGDMVLEAWINGLLSGPQTHAVNMLSNSLYSMWQVPERALAAQIGRLTGSEGVQVGEATAQAFGLVKGMRDGLNLAANALKTGESSDLLGKVDTPTRRAISGENLELSGIPGRAVDFLGEIVRIPGRLLTAEDEFFKSVGYRMELNARAFRTATGEGLTGNAMAERVQQIIANPPEDVKLAAIDAARYQTFTKPLGQAGAMFQAIVNKMPALRVIFPFIRTPINIMKGVGERTPLAFASKAVRAEIAAGGARRDMALAKISLGSMVMAVTADAALSGQVTGAGPSDPALKERWRATHQPYSIKVGNEWVAYNRLDPLGTMIGMAADMADIMGQAGDVELDDTAAAVVMAVSNNVVNKTYLSSVADTIALFNQVTPEMGVEKGMQYVKNLAGTLIPTGVAQLERTMDPTMRDARTMVDQLMSRIPGYSDQLPPRRNLWGEPIVLQGGLGPDIVSPLYTQAIESKPIDEEIYRLRLPIQKPARVLDGVELTPHEYSRFVELAGNGAKNDETGQGLRDFLEDFITTPEYQQLSDGADGSKALAIRKVVQEYRQLAKAKLLDENPGLERKVSSAIARKYQALEPQSLGEAQSVESLLQGR